MHSSPHQTPARASTPTGASGPIGRIQAFLFWCAGADPDYLAESPRIERVKVESVGAIVCLTAVAAFASMFLAVRVAFAGAAPWLPFAAAPVWAAFIFVLDRFIVSTMLPHGGRFPRLVQTSLRVLLAVLIALVIARPLEIKIFETEIEQRLGETLKATIEERVADINAEFDGLLAERRTNRDLALAPLEAALARDSDELQRKRERLAEVQEGVDRLRDGGVAEAAGETGRPGTGPIYDAIRQALGEQKDEADALAGQVAGLADRVRDAGAEKRAIEDAFAEQRRAITAERESALAGVRDATTYASIFGFLDYHRALGELAAGDPDVASVVWVVTLLLVMVEVAPVLVKSISPAGPYDHRIAAEYGISKEMIAAEVAMRSEVRKDFLEKHAAMAKAVFDMILEQRLQDLRDRPTPELGRLLASVGRYVGGGAHAMIGPPEPAVVDPLPEEVQETVAPPQVPVRSTNKAVLVCAPVACFVSFLVVANLTQSIDTGFASASLLLGMVTLHLTLPRGSRPQPAAA